MMYTRGQFALLGNVGRKALRIYHEEGLLVPVMINEENGYHYYDESQLLTLEKIKRLRKIGLSLYEIKQILNGKADEDVLIESRIKEADSLLKEMKQLASEKQQIKEVTGDIKPDIQSFVRERCLYLEENVDLEKLGMSVGKLYEKAARNSINVEDSHFVIYEGLLDEEKFRMTTCLPISGASEEKTLEINEPSCLHVNFKGGFSKVSEAHKIIQEYAEKQGILLTDRAYEVYNKDMSVDVYYPQSI